MPESPEEVASELRRQETILSQIHSKMNAGSVTKRREEELWETQRIITQLKVSLLVKLLLDHSLNE
jgi:RalA-binding protein 1